MSYLINIMYGDIAFTKRFRFDSDKEDDSEDFDRAVKDINKMYHENGRFKTSEEVVEHFRKYGFYQIGV